MTFSYSTTQAKRSKGKTVRFNGLTLSIPPQLYDPHEDSEMLAEQAAKHGHGAFLDMGCGSGIVGISAAKNPAVKNVVFADLNENALKYAKQNASRNNVTNFTLAKTDLFSSLARKFDCIAFNPPYLPTTQEELLGGEIDSAFDGGATGRKVLDEFLQQFPRHLKPKGTLLLLNSSISTSTDGDGNAETRRALEKKGFSVETLAKKSFFFERLVLLKAEKTTPTKRF